MRDAAEREHPSAQFALGYETEGGERVQWFRRAAEHGHPQAQCALGCCLLSGEAEGDSAQHEREAGRHAAAVPLLERAAAMNHAGAQCQLAFMHFVGGGGLPVDQAKAAALYQQSANQDYAHAQLRLSAMHTLGEGGLLRIGHIPAGL